MTLSLGRPLISVAVVLIYIHTQSAENDDAWCSDTFDTCIDDQY